jgi:O-antigen ligase
MIAAVVCLLMLLPFLAGKEISNRFFSVQQYREDVSAQSRFDSWKAALGIALDYPILGVGVRNSEIFSNKYGADMQGRTIHSVYLQVAADSGFPAMGFYLATFFIAWRTLRRFQKQYRNSYEHRLAYNLACGLEAALAVFLIGGVFLSLETFELPYLLILLALQLPASVPVEEVSFTRYKTVEFEHAAAPAK